jgi:hypothetical protein
MSCEPLPSIMRLAALDMLRPPIPASLKLYTAGGIVYRGRCAAIAAEIAACNPAGSNAVAAMGAVEARAKYTRPDGDISKAETDEGRQGCGA